MFLFWLRTYPTATWQDLVDALKAPGVELYNVAAMVETTLLFTCLQVKIQVAT